MKILVLDIETAPNVAYVWGLWKQNVSLNQIKEDGYVLSWSAKWLDKKRVEHRCRKDSDMLKVIHDLLTEADAVVHYNGTKFDMPWLNSEFIRAQMPPPAPYHQIDLLRTVRQQFKFPSNKLAYVAPALGIGDKVDHMTFEDWVGCMEGKNTSWTKMVKYNIEDVKLTEKLYYKLLAWIKGHPNRGLYKHEQLECPSCGSENYIARGDTTTRAGVYKRYSCKDCDTWFRGVQNIGEQRKHIRVNY
jgi:DNA polymerase elongation subunit (family B)/predicted RNA-binding Zn-ribbon protein involved in translation (DUF1610 family)